MKTTKEQCNSAICQEVARAAALPPSLGGELVEPAKDSNHGDTAAGDENKEAKSLTDLPLSYYAFLIIFICKIYCENSLALFLPYSM